jgi:arsenite/tail-anchored protein-transporting ATPase
VSADPAHSLGDALGRRLASAPRPVAARLSAVEIDAPRAFRRWLRQHGRALGDILERGTWLDREDVDTLLDLSLPGVDELVALLEINRLARAGSVDRVIVDTAPTGHALRMLAAPAMVTAVAGALDALHETHRIIRDQLARVGGPDAADRLVAALEEQSREMGAALRDPRRTLFHWVTLPEELSIAETAGAIAALRESGIGVHEIVVNRVVPGGPACPVCDRRRALERDIVARIRRQPRRFNATVRVVPDRLAEPRGLRALREVGEALIRRKARRSEERGVVRTLPSRIGNAREPAFSLPHDAASTPPETLDALCGVDLVFVAGKGGVGKTTIAATMAVRVAMARPDVRVLLMSTDPAHSLGDVLKAPVGDEPAPVPGAPPNLAVREIAADRALAARRTAVEAALDELANTAGIGSIDGLASGVFDLAPPGIDELFGMLSILESSRTHDLIVVDTAPTGHALRLLEMPEIVRDWVQALMRVLLKYRSVARPGALGAELVELSRSIRELGSRLRDVKRTRVVVVSRAAAVPFAETGRFVRDLRRLSLAVSTIVINAMTLAPGRCPRCRAVAAAERRVMAALGRRSAGPLRRCAIIQTPLAAPPPRGADTLARWGCTWTRWSARHSDVPR